MCGGLGHAGLYMSLGRAHAFCFLGGRPAGAVYLPMLLSVDLTSAKDAELWDLFTGFPSPMPPC